MAFTPFTADDQPTMAAFNEKFQSILADATDKVDSKIVIGTYMGTFVNVSVPPVIIELGFTPSAVFIENCTGRRWTSSSSYTAGGLMLPDNPIKENSNTTATVFAEIVENGFKIYYDALNAKSYSPYRYIAIR